ncbi:MAG: hypothetical protein HPY83_06570 [Anaerolineae bacterium]|nr:hypothetical protein [Anaerolineae bacterium]
MTPAGEGASSLQDRGVCRQVPVVGIGASAGGLEALEEFFAHVPVNSGMAYVVVQHMSPTHPIALVELLARSSGVPVVEAIDGMPVVPDRAYVIPPGCYLSITDGVLNLSAPDGRPSLHNTVDLFLRSLAAARHEEAIGVILSGSGTDGTLGIRAIKGEGGLVVVQDPTTAAYDGMPTSAIATGLADLVLPVHEMPRRIMEYVSAEGRTLPALASPGAMEPLRSLLALMRAQTGVDFSYYKQTTIVRRVQRRMIVRGIASIPEYVRRAREDPQEGQALFRELLINVTSFFRDAEAFRVLSDRVLPHLLEGKGRDDALRVWVPACSSGEEPYSIAIVIREYLARTGRDVQCRIFATDLDPQAIDTARAGVYPRNISVDVSPERLARFFHRQGSGFRIGQAIRETVAFAVHNALQDPPLGRMDLISCRNLLIYLDAEAQRRLLERFYFGLVPEGVLFLGASETVGDGFGMFAPLDRKWRFFVRRERAPQHTEPGTGRLGECPSASVSTGHVAPGRTGGQEGCGERLLEPNPLAVAPRAQPRDLP